VDDPHVGEADCVDRVEPVDGVRLLFAEPNRNHNRNQPVAHTKQSRTKQREREREKYQTHSVNSRNHRHGQAHCRSAVPVSEPQSTDQSNWHKTPFHIDDSDATPHRTTSYHTIPHQRLSLLSSSNHGQEQARTLRVQNPNGVRHLAHSFTRLSSIHFGFEAMVVSFCYNDLEQVLVCFTREAGGLLMLLLWVPTAPIATNKQRSLTVVAKSFKFNTTTTTEVQQET
jgi:hypothetical protein